jgi:UDP-N-acetylglucosamine:LPS N-acetylglucosamine transferase
LNNVENINKNGKSPRVLVAPLDWGLGHATRCIPVINALLAQGATVILAAEGAAATLLNNEFPTIQILPLKGYRISYSRQKTWFFLKMMAQIPKITATINYEKRWLKVVMKSKKIDLIISDNRFGLYSSLVPSYYITHQLFIETGNSLMNKLAQKIHYSFINRYTQCWVPDEEGEINLAGKLSHPDKKPAIPVKYIGILSRFKKEETIIKNELLILISGPEPQRSIFEKIIQEQIKDIKQSTVLVRGLPGETKGLEIKNDHVTIINHLPAGELNTIIAASETVICRAGYSTIMDLVTLNKNAALVPTPGQGEQEYLAKYLMEKKYFYSVPQHNFSINKILADQSLFNFSSLKDMAGFNKNVIAEAIKNAGF